MDILLSVLSYMFEIIHLSKGFHGGMVSTLDSEMIHLLKKWFNMKIFNYPIQNKTVSKK